MGKHIKTFNKVTDYLRAKGTFTERHVAFIRETNYVDFGDYDNSNLNEFGLEGDLIITAESNPPVFAALNDAGIPYDTTAGGYTIADLAAITDEDLMPLDEYGEASEETTVFFNKPIVNFNEFKYFTGIDGTCFYEGANDVQLFGYEPALKRITIPKNISCEENVFRNCFRDCGLDYIAVDEENQLYDSRGNCNAVISKSTNTLVRATNNTVIPTTVTAIGASAFSHLTINAIIIPEHITEIGDGAFQDCENLTSATILGDITELSSSVFSFCKNLTSFTIPSSVTNIGSWAFSHCEKLNSLTIPSSVTNMGSNVFWGCVSLNTITCESTTPPTISNQTFLNIQTNGTLIVPTASENTYFANWIKGKTNFYLGYYGWIINDIVLTALSNPALYQILWGENQIPHSPSFGYRISDLANITNSQLVETLDNNDTDFESDDYIVSIFNDCDDLTSFEEFQYFTGVSADILTKTQRLNGAYLGFFAGCSSLTKIVLPPQLTHIGNYCFYNLPITEITIPQSVSYIYSYAFYGTNITRIEIPSSVISLGSRALCCPMLTEIVCNRTTQPSIGDTVFGSTIGSDLHIPSNGTLKYPAGANYSRWLSTNNYYLGHFGWTGVEI